MSAARVIRGTCLFAWLAGPLSVAIVMSRHGLSGLVDSDVLLAAAVSSAFGFIAWIGAGQQPGNRLIWALSVFMAATAFLALGVAVRSVIAPDVPLRLSVETYVPTDIPRTAAWIEMVSVVVASSGQLVLLTFGMLLFPDGRVPSPRWRPIAILSAAAVVGLIPVNIPVWHPDSASVVAEHPLFHVSAPFLLGLPLLSLASVVARFRGAGATERARIKWMIWALSVFVPLALLGMVGSAGFVIAAGLLILVTAYGISIIRHRLFDVDVVISRTLVFGALAVFIGVVYVAVVVGLGALVGSADEPNTGLAIGATAIVAVAFQPVRRRMERVANRVVFGRRATPYEVLSEFSQRVAATSDVSFDEAARSLAEGTRAERVVISIRVDGDVIAAAVWPETPSGASSEVVSLPIEDSGAALGSLDLYLPPGQQLQEDDRRLAEQVASGMGLVLRNQLLTERLEARVEELRESRRRLVAVQDETRRRLERDLHDGAQQQLVALKVKLGLAKAIADKDGALETAERLQRLAADADAAVDAMREFARGVYPPLLEAEGLSSAITAHTRRVPIPVTVDSDGIGRYSRQIESTIYFCVIAALDNVTRYAGASSATVALRQHNGTVAFTVHDDGQGFDPGSLTRGDGLTNMEDRLDASGGTLQLTATPGHGTTITGTLPAVPPQEATS